MGAEDVTAMSDARLAEIRAQVEEARLVMSGHYTTSLKKYEALKDDYIEQYVTQMPALLAEVERLRAREAALVALAEMVDACEVLWASVESPFDRRARMRVLANWSNPDRAVESIQKQARALLASGDDAK